MNRPIESRLIETSDFDVGPWRVRPSRSQIEADGDSVKVEPRVMGVLVALAHRRGATVAREQLIDEVWDGRVVTDDAVQRCIAALRKVLRSRPGADIETIPKLGYALRIAASAGPASASRAEPEETPRNWRASAVLLRFRSWLLPAAGVLLVLGAASWWMSADIPASSPSVVREARSVPLTSLRGRETQPALSPSGGQVAFVWSGEDGAHADIYIKTVNADGLLRLTDDPARDLRPAWSPDGAEIAFARLLDTRTVLMRMPAIGGPARQVASFDPAQVRALDWAPDGNQIALALATDDLAPARLAIVDLRSGEARTPRALEELNAGIEDARFSPDGSMLAFTAGRALGVEDVHVYRFEDRTLTRLTFDQLKVHNLDWSADGNAVVFSSNRGGPFRLWQVPLQNGVPALVAGAGDSADDPSVAPNGRTVYEVWREDAEIVRFDLTDPQSAPRAVLASTRFEWDARVSPDGKQIAYISDQSGAAEVWVARRDGGSARRLTSFAGPYTHSPRWSPDGSRLAFVSPVSGRMNLFVLALDEGRPRRIGASNVDYFAPSWSADASAVVAGGRSPGGVVPARDVEAAAGEIRAGAIDVAGAGTLGTRKMSAFATEQASALADEHAIWILPPGGGTPRRLGPAGARTAQISADGAWLYYTRVGAPGLWRRGAVGVSQSSELLIPELTPVDWNNWIVTPVAIWYVQRTAGTDPVLARYDLESRATRIVRALPGLLYKSGLWVSPDERELIATVVLSAESDLHMLEPAG